MNNQEIFDTVSKHLLAQGERCETQYGCQYRGPRGLKCGIGCLIDDDKYHHEMENTDVRGVIEQFPDALPDFSAGNYPDLLVRLQSIHDNGAPEYWPIMLGEAAKDYGLKA